MDIGKPPGATRFRQGCHIGVNEAPSECSCFICDCRAGLPGDRCGLPPSSAPHPKVGLIPTCVCDTVHVAVTVRNQNMFTQLQALYRSDQVLECRHVHYAVGFLCSLLPPLFLLFRLHCTPMQSVLHFSAIGFAHVTA